MSMAWKKPFSRSRSLPQQGTQSIVETKDGIIIGLLNSRSGDPAEYKAEVNEWVWSKFFVNDTSKYSLLFQDAFGLVSIADIRQDKPDSFVLSSNDYARASLGPVPDRPNARPGWLGFIRVDSVDDTVDKAKGLRDEGDSSPRRVTEGKSKMAILADPTGAPPSASSSSMKTT